MMSPKGGWCAHCGGPVNAEGYSDGGEVGDVDSGEFMIPENELKEAEQREPQEDDHTEQQDSTELMRARAFTEAFSARPSHGDFKNGNPKTKAAPEEDLSVEQGRTSDEMSKKKQERYGFMKRRG